MQLIRNQELHISVKNLCEAPTKKEGRFFALANANDLPEPKNGFLNADLPNMLKNGEVWISKAGTEPTWQKVEKMADLPKFSTSYSDSYEACKSFIVVSPFMPQFFFVPKNSRGRKILKL